MGTLGKLKHAWNAIVADDNSFASPGYGSTVAYGSTMPSRTRLNFSNERSIIAAIYTRLAIDFASMAIRHVRLDADDRFLEEIPSALNNCLRLTANLDQGARAFRQDIAMSLFDEGAIAVVPIDTTLDPRVTGGYDVQTMRVGRIKQWMPRQIRVEVYDDRTGKRREITVDKTYVAIVENPLYSVMNEPNSTLQRLIRKLNLLDAVDEQSSSGKLDLIIQLPYVIKSEARQKQAEQRRKDIEFQLKGSQYGIAYTDGTEKVTQLNRPAENNLMTQIQYLIEMLYGQLGLTPEVMNGTADEKTMLNYFSRTIEPLLDAVTEAMTEKFLTKTARTQGHAITYYRDPFKLVPISVIADIADKFTRNEIASSNDIRTAIGWKPSADPKADELRNSNMPAPSEPVPTDPNIQEGDSQNGSS